MGHVTGVFIVPEQRRVTCSVLFYFRLVPEAFKCEPMHRKGKPYHLFSHIFRPEFVKYNLNYTCRSCRPLCNWNFICTFHAGIFLGIKVFIILFRFQSSVEVFSIKGNMSQPLKADHVNITIVIFLKCVFVCTRL